MKTMSLLAILVLISGCDDSSSPRDTNPLHLPAAGFVGDFAKGEILFKQNCQSCHGEGGRGSDQGPPLVHRTYKSGHHADLSFNLAVKNGVRAHHWKFGDMKPLPEVSPEMVGHITQYVRQQQKLSGIH